MWCRCKDILLKSCRTVFCSGQSLHVQQLAACLLLSACAIKCAANFPLAKQPRLGNQAGNGPEHTDLPRRETLAYASTCNAVRASQLLISILFSFLRLGLQSRTIANGVLVLTSKRSVGRSFLNCKANAKDRRFQTRPQCLCS